MSNKARVVMYSILALTVAFAIYAHHYKVTKQNANENANSSTVTTQSVGKDTGTKAETTAPAKTNDANNDLEVIDIQ